MKRKLTQLLSGANLPDEGLPKQPLLELLADDRVLIENHKGILEYGPGKICVRVAFGTIHICGQGLHLKRMQAGQLVIFGKIEDITVCREGCK